MMVRGWLLFLCHGFPIMDDFRVESHNLADLSDFLHRRKSHIEAAMRKAARSTLNMLKLKVADEVKGELKVKVRLLEKIRMRFKVKRKGIDVSLWVGSNPILVQFLRPSLGAKGVMAAGKSYPRSFMPWKGAGDPIIFQRVGKSRLPIVRPSEPIDEAVARVLAREWGGLNEYFFKIVRRFLNESER